MKYLLTEESQPEHEAPKKQPVLLQVLPSLYAGGVERGTLEIARAAVKEGFKSLVTSSGGQMVDQLVSEGSEHILLDLMTKNPLKIKSNAKLIEGIINEHDVDIVHARSRAPAWSAYKACKKNNTHFITTFHGTYSLNAPFKKKYNSVMAKGAKVIAISNMIKDHLEKTYKVPENRIELIYRGVDLEYFNPDAVSDERVAAVKKNWRIESPAPIIFMPGRITRWKGQCFLLDALSRINEEPFYCIMAGDTYKHPKYYDELMAQIAQYHLEKKVRIIDPITDMPAAYKACDVVVSASTKPEAFGRVAVEAQAMGKPVVATDLGGSKETIIQGETGRLVSSFTSGDMAEGVKRGLTIGKSARQNLAINARQHIIDNFSMDSMCNKTIALYRDILNRE